MKEGRKWTFIITGAIIVVALLRGFLFTSYIIPSSGMENALYQGDRILANRWSYGLRIPCLSLFSYHRWHYRSASPGDVVVFNNPASQEPVIDRRSVFIGRCIAGPGDTLRIDSLLVTQPLLTRAGPDRKELYSYPSSRKASMDSLLQALSITENELMGYNDSCLLRSFSHYEYYLLEQASGDGSWIRPTTSSSEEEAQTLIIPRKGKSIPIHPGNITLLRNTILLHEGQEVYAKNDSLFVNGVYHASYTFTKDYYWMVSNNSLALSDSRLFGLVPHDHLIGRASLVWFSKESYSGPFSGYRWNRFFTLVK